MSDAKRISPVSFKEYCSLLSVVEFYENFEITLLYLLVTVFVSTFVVLSSFTLVGFGHGLTIL